MDPENVLIRQMEAEDVPGVFEIERRAFAMAWTPEMFYKEISGEQDSLPLVALSDGRLIAYAVLWFVGPRLHLANIAVAPAFRRRGVALRLLDRVFGEARGRGCRRVSLETRISNSAAIALFRRVGFRTVTISHGYYTDNDEDALVMICGVERKPDGESRETGGDASGGPLRGSPDGRPRGVSCSPGARGTGGPISLPSGSPARRGE